jgi:hypothetical protein
MKFKSSLSLSLLALSQVGCLHQPWCGIIAHCFNLDALCSGLLHLGRVF